MGKNINRMRNFKRILVCILVIIFSFGISFLYYINRQLNNIVITPLTKDNSELGIKSNVNEGDVNENKIFEREEKQDNSILNIALFGVDSRNSKADVPHSDCIIIATIDNNHNKIKLSSIMRDTYVKVNGHGKTKITEAYFYGGPKLAIRTLNENFNLDIKDYATVDFKGLSKIIDNLGGITANIKQYEIREINKYIAELSELQQVKYIPVYRSGSQNLNGIQAVAYCRIRQVGDGDFERTDRQRIILKEIFNKIRNIDITRYPYLAAQFSSYIETSMSKSNIIALGSKIILNNILTVDQQRFPVDGYCKGAIINKVWYLIPEPDLKALSKQINNYIYEDIKPIAKEPLF
ncbi:LCP family protein [Clostridium thailandense]|uniref:LCP family protein n=1 Tax=Clostridium thailandense TaxID=2794346 RepID=UPI0039892759